MFMLATDDVGETPQQHKIPPLEEDDDYEFSNSGFEVNTWVTVVLTVLAVIGIGLLLAWELHVL